MLAQRVATALVLVALLVLTLWAKALWPFDLLTLIFIAAAGWEWARLNQAGGAAAVTLGALLAVACAAALASGLTDLAPSAGWWLAAALWLLAAVVVFGRGPDGWLRLPRAARWALGLLALWAAWLAMAQSRAIGVNFLLSLFCLVWAADICAYFGGRAFGKRKLAPSISPGKTWAGVFSGMLGVLLLAWLWRHGEARFDVDSDSVFAALGNRFGIGLGVLSLLLLSATSVVGDLMESLVKRAAGAKDSSRLLPGHGGVLDRIDALLPVLPMTMALLSLR